MKIMEDIIMEDDYQDEYVPSQSNIINLKKMKSIKFNNDLIKEKIEFDSFDKIYSHNSTEEAVLDEEDKVGYLKWKFEKKYSVVPEHIFFDTSVFSPNFFNMILDKLKVPAESYKTDHYYSNKNMELFRLTIVMNKLLFYFNGHSSYLIYDQKDITVPDSPFNIFMGIIKAYKNPPIQKNKIYVVYQTNKGFAKKSFGVKQTDINIKENYNDGFENVSKDIIKKLNNEDKNGLVILHGIPGSGKTTYLRYLASKLKRDIIFISPDMVSHITDPSFIPFLMDNSDAILIIEDAEPALQKRVGDGRSGAVSNILNMTDGLLSDCLNLSIVATFNTTTKDIDDALLRKGRLLKAYKFDKLDKNKAQKLLDKEGIKKLAVEDMTLAEIYFSEDDNTDESISTPKRIGFGS